MPTPCRGRIVWVEMLDPQGRNPKRRPAVIVSADEEIKATGEAWVVAVSTQLGESPREDQVDLPWHADRHPRTGLTERCSAVCTWLTKIKVDSIINYLGTVPAAPMLTILGKVATLLPSAEEPPPETPA
jgi:mRNA-degrading endonuclease toxin of MazEF toxin-antitoxin module